MHRMLLMRCRNFVVWLFADVVVVVVVVIDVIINYSNIPTVDYSQLVLLFFAVTVTAAVTADTASLDERSTAWKSCRHRRITFCTTQLHGRRLIGMMAMMKFSPSIGHSGRSLLGLDTAVQRHSLRSETATRRT